MKTAVCSILALFGVAAFAAVVTAQSYSVDWHTVDGGGGTSSGGSYSVTGTIGQPDASVSTMSGGNYAVVGGFWSYAAAVQMPGAPYLTVKNTSTNTVAVSWPYPSTDFVLQENSDLSTTNWTTVSTSAVNDGINWTVIVSPPVGNRFYRLFHP